MTYVQSQKTQILKSLCHDNDKDLKVGFLVAHVISLIHLFNTTLRNKHSSKDTQHNPKSIILFEM